MSRLSYGGGMFSPIRCDKNDEVFNDQQESDVFSQWKEICIGEISTKSTEDFSNEVSDKKDGNSTSANQDNSAFVCKHEKSSANSDNSQSKRSYITTRRKNSVQNNQNSLETPLKTSTWVHNEVKTNKKKDSLSKFVSVRSEMRKSNEFRTSKTKQSSNFYTTSSLPGLTEEQFGVKCLSPENDGSTGNKGRSLTSAPCDVQNLSKINKRKEKKQNSVALVKESTSNESENRSDKSLTIDCEVQTGLLMSELNLKVGKKVEDSVSNSCYETTSASNLHISSNPQQIQANIIEKLVKDTVSFEFDGIRQMLYLQQLSLFKYMDKNIETERQNSILQTKYIEALVKENQRLRDEVTAYQNFFKV